MKYHSAMRINKLPIHNHMEGSHRHDVKQRSDVREYILHGSIFCEVQEKAKLNCRDEVRIVVAPAGSISEKET